MSEEITRDVAEGVGPGGIDVRIYTDGQKKLPSVTSVLKTRDDDKSNLYAWQERNDGEGDAAFHKHLFWYSRHVGTLGHWFALHKLDPSLEWNADEEQSKLQFRRVGTDAGEDEVTNEKPRDVLYSILKSQHAVESWGEFYDQYDPYGSHDYYRDAIYEQAKRDIAFFVDGQQRLWSKLGLTNENVIAVEKFLFNQKDGYAGQVDLIYEDDAGYTVAADLKSSSGCYDKHQIQGAAYARSAMVNGLVDNVDRLEVHRAHPRSGQMAVHTHRDAPGKKSIHTTKYWNEGYDELWGEFEELLTNFEGHDYTHTGTSNSDRARAQHGGETSNSTRDQHGGHYGDDEA